MKCFIRGNVGAGLVPARDRQYAQRFGQARGLPLRILSVFLINFPLYACPLCKDAIPNDMAKGFFWSILLMLAVPAVVVSVIAGVVWRALSKRPGHPGAPHE